MKKTILVLFLMVIGLSVFAQSSDNRSGVIRDLSGSVELKASGASQYVPAKAGDAVRQDTVISTGFKSTALVELGSTVITVRPLTRLTLTEISASAGTETLNVNLQAGRVRVDVNPPAGTRAAMTVSSPVATASVRGTSFEFDTRALRVTHGSVVFAGRRGPSTTVNGGSDSRVEPDGRTVDPVKTRSGKYRPPAPVGADSSSGSKSDSSQSTGMISITLNYFAGAEETH